MGAKRRKTPRRKKTKAKARSKPKAAVAADAAARESAEEQQDIAHKTWACDKLLSLLQHEDARRKSLENKATYGTGILLGLIGLVVQTAAGSAPRFSLVWWLFVIGTGLMGCAVYATVRAIRVQTYPVLNPDQLAHPSVLDCAVAPRLEVLAGRLIDLVKKTEKITNQKAEAVLWSQYCALAGVLCYLLGIVGGKL